MDNIDVYADGACICNPGPAGSGVVMICGKHKRKIGKYLGENLTNNIAELTAIKTALESIINKSLQITIYTDSKYAIGVLVGGFKAKKNVELIEEIKTLILGFPSLKFEWVKGHESNQGNIEADHMANTAARAKKDEDLRMLV